MLGTSPTKSLASVPANPMSPATSASIPRTRRFGGAPFSLTPSHQTAEVTRSPPLPSNFSRSAGEKWPRAGCRRCGSGSWQSPPHSDLARCAVVKGFVGITSAVVRAIVGGGRRPRRTGRASTPKDPAVHGRQAVRLQRCVSCGLPSRVRNGRSDQKPAVPESEYDIELAVLVRRVRMDLGPKLDPVRGELGVFLERLPREADVVAVLRVLQLVEASRAGDGAAFAQPEKGASRTTLVERCTAGGKDMLHRLLPCILRADPRANEPPRRRQGGFSRCVHHSDSSARHYSYSTTIASAAVMSSISAADRRPCRPMNLPVSKLLTCMTSAASTRLSPLACVGSMRTTQSQSANRSCQLFNGTTILTGTLPIASALITTYGRFFCNSAPAVLPGLTHHTSPRLGCGRSAISSRPTRRLSRPVPMHRSLRRPRPVWPARPPSSPWAKWRKHVAGTGPRNGAKAVPRATPRTPRR